MERFIACIGDYVALWPWLVSTGVPAMRPTHAGAGLLQPKMVKVDPKGAKEIPIPGVVRIVTYRQDYVPTWRERNTYIRPKGGVAVANWVLLARLHFT